MAEGLPVTPDVGCVTFDEAVADLLNDYALNQRKSTEDTRRRIEKHIRPFFGNRRMIAIITADLRAFAAKRQKDGVVVRRRRTGKVPPGESAIVEAWQPVSAAELNRELTTLKRCSAWRCRRPSCTTSPTSRCCGRTTFGRGSSSGNSIWPCSGICPRPCGLSSTFAYVTGWRINSEVLPLQWRQVDLAAGEVRLDPGTTENGEGRVFYLTPELQALLQAQRERADEIQRDLSMIVQHVFFDQPTMKDGSLGVRAGKGISGHGFYQAWRRARTKAGCPGSIPHDFRRTAIRNMVRAGIPERVAMACQDTRRGVCSIATTL